MGNILSFRYDRGGLLSRSARWALPIGVGARVVRITFDREARGLVVLARVAVFLAVTRLSAVGTLLLGLRLGTLGRPIAVLVSIVGVAGVEVSFLEGSLDRVENQGVETALLQKVLLDGKDLGFLHTGTSANWPGFVSEQVLCFFGIFGALSDGVWILLQDLGPKFR